MARGEYKVTYKGYLFYGDTDGWNTHIIHGSWDEIAGLINAYGNYDDLELSVTNEYGATWYKGEWS